MSFSSRLVGVSLTALVVWLAPLAASAQTPQLINYQGRLLNGTNLVNGNVGLSLGLYDAPTGGNLLYEDSNIVTVVDGLYATFIGDDTVAGDLGVALAAPAVYVETSVEGVPLSPRERMVAAAYAVHAWGLSGNAGTSPGSHFIGTTDNQPLEIRVNGARVLRVESVDTSANMLGGSPVNVIGGSVTGATISGGGDAGFYLTNRVDSSYATVAGGLGNVIEPSSPAASVGGGRRNTIGYSVLAPVNSAYSHIGGGEQNQILAPYAVIGGGVGGFVAATNGIVGGGYHNTIAGKAANSTISGGRENWIGTDASDCTVGGGRFNQIDGTFGNSIGGGEQNQVRYGIYATIGGGYKNLTGNGSTFQGWYATVAGGNQNNAEGDSSCVPGGQLNWAKGTFSFAAGRQAKALANGAFVWADSQNADFAPNTINEVSFRCQNGVTFSSDSAYSQTAHWTPGSASWSFTSDRNTKEAIAPVDTKQVLDKVARLPISEWQYKGYTQRHIGPMAQDFHAEFPLNDNDRVLNEADLHGVALAAIQALAKQNADLRLSNDELKRQNAEILQRLRALEENRGNVE